MKKHIKVLIGCLILIFCLLTLTGCSSESTIELENAVFENVVEESIIDYTRTEDFENDLNNGVNVEGKTVKFVLNDYKPDSILGHNSWAGEHLNFISKIDLKLKKDDEIIGKVVSAKKSLGSWIINYEVLQINIKNTDDINEIKENNNTIVNEVKETDNTTVNEIKENNNKIENESTKENNTQIKKDSQNQQNKKTPQTTTKEVDRNKDTSSTIQSHVTTTNSNLVWIPKSGKKYHSNPKCSNMKNPSQVTKASAESNGYTPCKKCY